MSPNDSTSLHIEAKRTYTPKKVTIPSHDCQPEIVLMVAGKEKVVEREVLAGVEWAKSWLREPQGLRLDQELCRIRQMVGALRWPTVELGFTARIDQRLAALATNYPITNINVQILPAPSPEADSECLAIGNGAMKLMLEQLSRVAALAQSGELRPSSQQAGQALEAVAALVGCIELVGPVDSYRDRS